MLDEKLIRKIDLLKHWPIDSDWTPLLEQSFRSPSFESLSQFVSEEYDRNQVFPPVAQIFNAFRLCPLSETKVVILGQDPYHAPGQAHGLCFSVPSGTPPPPSLKNIFRELYSDVGVESRGQTDLSCWAQQGVLLLNTVLTVRSGQANSHRKRGWEPFTDSVIKLLAETVQPQVFVLWGKPAASKSKWIHAPNQILESPHPSPLSAYRGFFGSRPFSKINNMLQRMNLTTIDWQL